MASVQAQQLVNLSLDKIQNARRKKTGLNLHRSLLVSTVLFKAKTAIIMAKYNMKCDYEQSESTEDSDCEEMEDDQQVPDIDIEAEPDTSDDTEQDYCDMDYKENNPPKVCSNEWEENNVLSDVSIYDVSSDQSDNNVKCNKCVKRRLTEVESAVDSITKRQCMESNNSLPETDESEPMDCVQQVSTIVDSFTCGFNNLLCENNSQNIINTNEQSQPIYQSSGLSEAFNTCSTQIKDALAIASPILVSV